MWLYPTRRRRPDSIGNIIEQLKMMNAIAVQETDSEKSKFQEVGEKILIHHGQKALIKLDQQEMQMCEKKCMYLIAHRLLNRCPLFIGGAK